MPEKMFVTGGGVHHPVIMQMLEDRFGEITNVREAGGRIYVSLVEKGKGAKGSLHLVFLDKPALLIKHG